jgi:phage virion morphogenesis protein
MAGAGIEVTLDGEFSAILAALNRASRHSKRAIADFMGGELHEISMKAFADEADPVTGKKWEPLKYPPSDGDGHKILQDNGTLRDSLTWDAQNDGAVVFGSNRVYARIHQQGGTTRAHPIKARNGRVLSFLKNGKRVTVKSVKHPGSRIPARPYMGVPADFDRRVLTDPAVLRLFSIGVTP